MSEYLDRECEEEKKRREKRASSSQHDAANPHISAWVEASAGTGKTKVLSDRFLRLLLEGVSPARILCLTYTKAAAAEMKSRISERLSEWSVQSDEKLRENLKKLFNNEYESEKKLSEYASRAKTLFAVLLDTPGGMKIRTIHAFCEEILKRFPLEAEVSPYFEIIEERDVNEALKQIQDEILQECGRTDSPESKALLYLTENLKETTFPAVMGNITTNHAKIKKSLQKYGGLEGLLAELQKKLGVTDDDTEEKTKAECMRQINQNDLNRNIDILKDNGKNNNKKALELEKVYNSGCSVEYCDDYISSFVKSDGKIYDKKTLASGDALKEDAEILTRMLNEAERLQKVYFKCRKIRIYRSTKAFLTIARSINDKYEEYKKIRSCLDFSDIIDKTCNLLSNSDQALWVLYKLDGGIDHILLDEAQDTSPQQWDIIKALSEEFFNSEERGRTIFAVGDRKQSIFSFQGADPQKFDEMSDYFAKHAGAGFKRVGMEYSFRSSPAVLESVNTVFADEKVADGVISPNNPVEHIPTRVGAYGKVEVWPLLVAEKGEEVSLEDKLLPPVEMKRKTSVCTKLARQIADKIVQMMKESAGSKRPLHYKDFMILVRHRNNFMDEFIRVCKEKKYGINISGADKMVLSEQIAVQDLISLGKFLLLPEDDLSLAEVLKSPLFGLTDADLENLCCERKQASLWASLAGNKQYKDTYKQLSELIGMLDFIRPFELFNHVLVNMNGRKKFMQRLGVEAEDAIDEFMNLTIAYERTQIPNLQGFISWFENDETTVKREGENTENDAVRLMTVHHSKGLQARVVFLPDCVQLPQNNRSQKLLSDDNGLTYYPLCSSDYDEICDRIKDDNGAVTLEEYRRLLYVALTRAEDQLIVCGYSNYDKVSEDSWFGICRKAMENKYRTDKNNIVFHETAEIREPEVKKKYFVPPMIMEPEKWMEEPLQSASPLAKPYTPSKMEDADEEPDSVSPLADGVNYYRRGSLIHKILQFLPADNSDKAYVIDEYMSKNAPDFSDSDKEQIKNEILNLLAKEEYASIFGTDSRAEVPVFGEAEGKIISAQIDRLVVQEDKITIVDFKTNRPAGKNLAETPDAYKKQLNVYKTLIEKIYPNRNVETYILWTNEARLMRVS